MSAHQVLLLTTAATIAAVPGTIAAQAPTRLQSEVYATFERENQKTQLIGLAVGNLLPGTVVTLLCTGAACPFESREIKLDRKVMTLALTDMFSDSEIKPGTTLEIRITRPGSIGKLYRYEVQAAGSPKVTTKCLEPGGNIISC